MSRFIRILAVALFILAVSVAPVLAMGGGGNHRGHHWGNHGKGGGGDGGCVPEIDPSLAPSAMALLAGGLLVLKSKSARR